jgi:hypothetical protein
MPKKTAAQASIVRSPLRAREKVEPQVDAPGRSIFSHRPTCTSFEKRPGHALGGVNIHLSGQSTMTPRRLQTLPRGPLPPLILGANGRPRLRTHDFRRPTSGEESRVCKITTRITRIHIDPGGDFQGKTLEVAGLWHGFGHRGPFSGGV